MSRKKNGMELLDRYAEVFGRQRIETTSDDNCFTRAFTTALQKDYHLDMDWRRVDELIRKELNNNKDHYNMFCTNNEAGKQWSFADAVRNPLDAFDAFAYKICNPQSGDKVYHPDLWINAAAKALNVQVVLVQLSNEQEPVERNFQPRSIECDKSVYIAYHCCGQHHFDALVKKSNLQDNVSAALIEDASAERKKNASSSGHSCSITNGPSQTDNNNYGFEKVNKDELHGYPSEGASGATEKNVAKEKASAVAGKNATKADDDKKDDDDNHCIICMDDITDKKELPCKHKFCRECIDAYFAKGQPKCPSCGKVFGTLRGDQPDGTMTWKEQSWRLAGYNDCGTIEINYSFFDGIQGDNHPNPGKPYRGTHRTAYLPSNKEGREVLRLLKKAFDAKLVFTIGQSNTTGQNNVVIWNDVHHKTSTNGHCGCAGSSSE